MGLWGEKVPPAGRTVTARLVESDLAAFDGQGAFLEANSAEVAALWAGLDLSKGLRLLLCQGAEGAFNQAASGSLCNLLHDLKVDVAAWSRLAEDAAGYDFAPASGQVVDFLELFSRHGSLRHDLYYLVLMTSTW